MFSVRIVTTDHYMSKPLTGLDVQYSEFRGSEVKKVPVVRIFGATPAGQKTCMHVHGVFPYLYVPYDGTVPWDRYLRQFASSLDKAINVALGHGQSTIQHVYKIALVSGIGMYGYHEKEQQFLKIYMYNPQMTRKAADLLLGGAVFNKAFQPHESHIPYTLQLFIDYNLYGMNMINVGAVKFRRRNQDLDVEFHRHTSQGSDEGLGSDPKTPTSFSALFTRSGTATPSRHVWEPENIPSEMFCDADVERESYCELEVDVVAADILNRLEVGDNVGANPGLAALWEDERQRCRDRGLSTDIAPPSSQERGEIENSDSDKMYIERLHDIILEQLPYMDSQSDVGSETSVDEELDIPPTPASQLELHRSQTEEMLAGSQDTVIFDEEEEAAPVINVDSIHRIVSSSQSFSVKKDSQGQGAVISSQDKSLVELLAALADNSSPPASQAAASQLIEMEEGDSVLAGTSQPLGEEVQQQEEEETLEMSQVVWEGEKVEEEEKEQKNLPGGHEQDAFDYAGLDDTWDGSLLHDKGDKSDEDDEGDIPQFDGAEDKEPRGVGKKPGTKRLGMHGPAMFSPANSQKNLQQTTPLLPQYRNQYGNNQGYPNSMAVPGNQPFPNYSYQSQHQLNQHQHQQQIQQHQHHSPSFNPYQNQNQNYNKEWSSQQMHTEKTGPFSPGSSSSTTALNRSRGWTVQQSSPLRNDFVGQQHQQHILQQQQQHSQHFSPANQPYSQHYPAQLQSSQNEFQLAQQSAMLHDSNMSYSQTAMYQSQRQMLSPTQTQPQNLMASKGSSHGLAAGDMRAVQEPMLSPKSPGDASALIRKKLALKSDPRQTGVPAMDGSGFGYMASGSRQLHAGHQQLEANKVKPVHTAIKKKVASHRRGSGSMDKRVGESLVEANLNSQCMLRQQPAPGQVYNMPSQHASLPSPPFQGSMPGPSFKCQQSPSLHSPPSPFPQHYHQSSPGYQQKYPPLVNQQTSYPDLNCHTNSMYPSESMSAGVDYGGGQQDGLHIQQMDYSTKHSVYPPVKEQPVPYRSPPNINSSGKSVITYAQSSNPFDDTHIELNDISSRPRISLQRNNLSPLSPSDFSASQAHTNNSFSSTESQPKSTEAGNISPGQPRFQSSPETNKPISALQKLLMEPSDSGATLKGEPPGSISRNSTLFSPSSIASEKQGPAVSRSRRLSSSLNTSLLLGSPVEGSVQSLESSSPVSLTLEKPQVNQLKQQKNFSSQRQSGMLNDSQQDLFSDSIVSPKNQRSLSTPSLSVEDSSPSEADPLDNTGCDELVKSFVDSLQSASESYSTPQEQNSVNRECNAVPSIATLGVGSPTEEPAGSSISSLESLVGSVSKDRSYRVGFSGKTEEIYQTVLGLNNNNVSSSPSNGLCAVGNSSLTESNTNFTSDPAPKPVSDYNFYNWPEPIVTSQQPGKTGYSGNKANDAAIKRSLSMPSERGRKGRMKKLGLLGRPRPVSISHDPPVSSDAYTYRFQVPTPVYKRLKLKLHSSNLLDRQNVTVVRMHPKDARKYSLLKVGQEVIQLHNMTLRDILKIQQDLKFGREVLPLEKIRTKSRSVADSSAGIGEEAEVVSEALSEPQVVIPEIVVPETESTEVFSLQQRSELPDEIRTAIVDPAENATEQSIVQHQSQVAKVDDKTVTMENPYLDSELLNVAKQKQRKNSKPGDPVADGKDKVKKKHSPKTKSVVPHLKKYRAGFQFFGKALGKKMRHSHPLLTTDLDEDTNIVLKDVSLTDASEGTLTPIKARTPISGRSPAHCTEHTFLESSENKDYLDTKLKSLDELGMFNERTIEKEELEEQANMGGSEEEDEDLEEEEDVENLDDHDVGNSQEGATGNEHARTNSLNSEEAVCGSLAVDSESSSTLLMDVVISETDTGTNVSEGIAGVPVSVDSESIESVLQKTCSDSEDTKQDVLVDSVTGSIIENEKYIGESLSGQESSKVKTSKMHSVSDDEEFSPVIEMQSETSFLVVSEPDEDLSKSISKEVYDSRHTVPLLEDDLKSCEFKKSDNCFTDIIKPRLTEGQCRNDTISILSEADNCDMRVGNNGVSSVVSGTSSECDLSPVVADISVVQAARKDTGADSLLDESKTLTNSCEPQAVDEVPLSVKGDASNSERTDSVEINGKSESSQVSVYIPKLCSRSSSCESQSPSSRGSRRGSTAKSSEVFEAESIPYSGALGRASSTSRDSFEFIRKQKSMGRKRKRNSSSGRSSKSQSRRRSRHSYLDDEDEDDDDDDDDDEDEDYAPSKSRKNNKRKKRKKHTEWEDSDTDGIEGVDYIIVGKFKGEKSMRVVLNRISMDKKAVSVQEFLEKQKSVIDSMAGKNGGAYNLETPSIYNKGNAYSSSYSAEFEKFLVGLSEQNGHSHAPEKKEAIVVKSSSAAKPADDMEEPPVLTREETRTSSVSKQTSAASITHGEGDPSNLVNYINAAIDREMKKSVSKVKKMDSSSSDEFGEINKRTQSSKLSRSHVKKRRGGTIHDRMSRAFLSRKKPRRKKTQAGPSKLMNTLSVLHDATMEKLTEPQHYNTFTVSFSKASKTATVPGLSSVCVKRPETLDFLSHKKPEQEVYGDTASDCDSKYMDTMYKLALFSPPLSEKGESSPPQPLSPEQIPNTVRMASNLSSLYDTPLSSVENIKTKCKPSDNQDEGASDTENDEQDPSLKKSKQSLSPAKSNSSTVKTAVVKLAPLTLKDIQSYCSEESEAESKASSKKAEESVSPPDLGPPIIPRFSPRHYPSSTHGNVTPPYLTPNRHRETSESGSCSEVDSAGMKMHYPRGSPRTTDSSDLDSKTAPPYLHPYTCKSPRTPLSPRSVLSPRTPVSPRGSLSPRVLGQEAGYFHKSDNDYRSYFSIPVSDTCRTKAGQSPAASSSTSSINIVHSEEFSDISDDDDPPANSTGSINEISYQQCQATAESLSLGDSGMHGPTTLLDKEQKLREIREFEERLKISDEKKNLFQMMFEKNRQNSFQNSCSPDNTKRKGIRTAVSRDQALDLSYSGISSHLAINTDTRSSQISDKNVMRDTAKGLDLAVSYHSFQELPQEPVFCRNINGSKEISGDLFDSSSYMSQVRHSHQVSTSEISRSQSGTHVDLQRYSLSQSSVVKNSQDKQMVKTGHSLLSSEDVPFFELGRKKGNKTKTTFAKDSSRSQSLIQGNSSGNCGSQDSHSGSSGASGLDGNDDDQDTDRCQPQQTSNSCRVITPQILPPARESIQQSAMQLGLPSVQPHRAYYGNPRDAPEKPRELGGHLLKVPTCLVKSLPEFETSVHIEGLNSWRTMLCISEGFTASQDEGISIIDRLEQEPNLKYALTGDRNIIISPCVVPPCRQKVEQWLKGRQIYKALIQEKKEKSETKTDDKKDKITAEKESKLATEDIEKGSPRLNLFTGKREIQSEESKSADIVLTEEEKMEVDGELKNSCEDFSITEENAGNLSSTKKTVEETQDTDAQLHSTPLLRRASSDLFEPSCTPIHVPGDKDKNQEPEAGSSFVTPKRVRPLRRLSTNTEKTLRRAIITTQMKQQFSTPHQKADVSQIEGPTPKNSFGFKVTQQNFQDAKALHEHQYLTVLSLELHMETRGDLRPDPEFDTIQAIFYSVFNDVPADRGTRHETGIIILDRQSANQQQASPDSANQSSSKVKTQIGASASEVKDSSSVSKSGRTVDTILQKSGVLGLKVTYVKDEKELLESFIQFILKWDPDILVGYEIQMLSWGYLLQRAAQLGVNLCTAISRVPGSKDSSHHSAAKDEWGADHASEIHVAGRIVLNLWRLLRHEVTLNVYTFENVVYHVLHQRVPLYSFRSLTAWYRHRTHLHRWKVTEHYITRVKASLEIMDKLDLIGRTSEFARVFGIEFYHVLSRGSQYRVESMMLRVAKPMNFIPVSPSVHQRARMKAPECIPLTLEPQSRFYTDPVVVLDFQSLYPSIMIAYNYCFSTCLGRLEWLTKAHEGPIEFGCTSLEVKPSVLKKLEGNVTVSPNGVVFLKQSVRQGVLPRMVEEILKTRLMVKKAMKGYKEDKTLSRMLDARQLGLKLIANVTYGYTGANFSGRMPCIEVGDSIVRKARETLERSIQLVEDTPRWGAKVIYGDTDSMFLLMKGRSKDEAFRIGQEIADAVTAMFPKPIKLKFEKVYLPCVLQTKKRYVGFMYETPEQKEPVYDAKGIETVRRDSCSAVSKILERSIKILFSSRNVSDVKSYVQHQCQKLMEGTVSLQDYIFAKEYRGMSGYRPGACVPALEISKKLIRQDRRSEPRVGERVPYVIVYGSPGLPLIQLVRQPMEVLLNESLRLNSTYYITKQILPPLHRFLSLLGVDVFTWYHEMPHVGFRAAAQSARPQDGRKGTISQYFATSNCPLCDKQTKHQICSSCLSDPQGVYVSLSEKMAHWERTQQQILQVCFTCTGSRETDTAAACMSIDCPILHRSSRVRKDTRKGEVYREILAKIFN